jgi:hypothetical protein
VTDIDTIKAAGTLLVLTGVGVPPFSCRGATQTLVPIQQAHQIKRTLNGVARDLSQVQFQKYSSVISCADQQAPAVDGVWPGRVVVVDCVYELCYLTANGGPSKPAVPGSSRVEGSFTFYRPRLEMMVIDFQSSKDEWGAANNWSMTLEEV